jgi:hypothetical protein
VIGVMDMNEKILFILQSCLKNNQGNPSIPRNVSSAKPIKVLTIRRFKQKLLKTPHQLSGINNPNPRNQNFRLFS